jgi:hypothetical protein
VAHNDLRLATGTLSGENNEVNSIYLLTYPDLRDSDEHQDVNWNVGCGGFWQSVLLLGLIAHYAIEGSHVVAQPDSRCPRTWHHNLNRR